jgi:hypothetical protein
MADGQMVRYRDKVPLGRNFLNGKRCPTAILPLEKRKAKRLRK